MGDFVKGKQFTIYPRHIRIGILLHREIDSFTDQNDIVKKSKDRLKPKYRHYAGVITDVFYDHFLALNFDQFSEQELAAFVSNKYDLLAQHKNQMPERAQHMLPYMIKGNWLFNYKELAGVHRSLTGMSRRTRFDSKMDQAILELKKYHELFNEEFLAFFPLIIAHANKYREELLTSHT